MSPGGAAMNRKNKQVRAIGGMVFYALALVSGAAVGGAGTGSSESPGAIEDPGSPGLDALSGTTWQLVRWAPEDPVGEGIEIDLSFDGDLIAAYDHPYLYFSDEVKNDRRIDLEALEAAVVEELKITLLGDMPRSQVIDEEAYQQVLQARYFWNRRSEGDVERVLEALGADALGIAAPRQERQ